MLDIETAVKAIEQRYGVRMAMEDYSYTLRSHGSEIALTEAKKHDEWVTCVNLSGVDGIHHMSLTGYANNLAELYEFIEKWLQLKPQDNDQIKLF